MILGAVRARDLEDGGLPQMHGETTSDCLLQLRLQALVPSRNTLELPCWVPDVAADDGSLAVTKCQLGAKGLNSFWPA